MVDNLISCVKSLYHDRKLTFARLLKFDNSFNKPVEVHINPVWWNKYDGLLFLECVDEEGYIVETIFRKYKTHQWVSTNSGV